MRARILVNRDSRTEDFLNGVAVGMAVVAIWVVWLA